MVLDDLIAIAEKTQGAYKQTCVRCCMAAGCFSSRSAEIKGALEKSVVAKGLTGSVEVRRVGCLGLCGEGPLVRVVQVTCFTSMSPLKMRLRLSTLWSEELPR